MDINMAAVRNRWHTILPVFAASIELYEHLTKSSESNAFFCSVSIAFYLVNALLVSIHLGRKWDSLRLGTRCLLMLELICTIIRAVQMIAFLIAIGKIWISEKVLDADYVLFQFILSLCMKLSFPLVMVAFYLLEKAGFHSINATAATDGRPDDRPDDKPDDKPGDGKRDGKSPVIPPDVIPKACDGSTSKSVENSGGVQTRGKGHFVLQIDDNSDEIDEHCVDDGIPKFETCEVVNPKKKLTSRGKKLKAEKAREKMSPMLLRSRVPHAKAISWH